MAKQKVTFEQALEKLEAIVSGIEQGDIPLERSIDEYARAIKLISQCREILDTAEKKIQLLGKAENNALQPTGKLDSKNDT